MYTKNVARPRSGFYLRNEFRAAGVRFSSPQTFYGGWFNENLVSKMSAIVKTISAHNFRAARAGSSEFIENNERILTDIQSSMIDGA